MFADAANNGQLVTVDSEIVDGVARPIESVLDDGLQLLGGVLVARVDGLRRPSAVRRDAVVHVAISRGDGASTHATHNDSECGQGDDAR